MKTDDEIKLGLQCCSHPMNCQTCPYNPGDKDPVCRDEMERDALALINRLEDENLCMRVQMHGDCSVCKHEKVEFGDEPCDSCIDNPNRPAWEYAGIPEVKKR